MPGAAIDAAGMKSVTGCESIADSDGVALAFLDGQGAHSMTSTTAITPWSVSDSGESMCGPGHIVDHSTAVVDFDFRVTRARSSTGRVGNCLAASAPAAGTSVSAVEPCWIVTDDGVSTRSSARNARRGW